MTRRRHHAIGIVLLAAAVGCSLAAERPLHLRAGTVDPASLPAVSIVDPARGPLLVQASDDPEQLRDRLRAAGARLLGWIPDGAWLVRISPHAMRQVTREGLVRWAGPPRPEWKRSPGIGVRTYRDPRYRMHGRLTLVVDLFAGADGGAVAAELRGSGVEVLGRETAGARERLRLLAPPAAIDGIASHPEVEWIEEAPEATSRNDTARWVVQSGVSGLESVWDAGLHGEGQIIGHIDEPLDVGSCFFEDPVDNTPAFGHRKVVAYRSSTGLGNDPHGTHTAATAVGARADGTDADAGHARAARLSHANLNDIYGYGNTASNLYEYLDLAYGDGARVHTNSWGDDGTEEYTTWCRDADRFAWDREDALVVFATTNLATLKSPENAKNVLAVAASRNGANADLFCSGGTGPTNDGRRKPEVLAPGCSIVSARARAACGTSSQTGTSMAAPAVAASGALVRQYFIEGWYPTGAPVPADAFVPSGALLKASLVNGSVDLASVAGYPSAQEGWGRLLLERTLHFAGEARTLRVKDVRHAEGVSTGEVSDLVVRVVDSGEPLVVTLAWTDPPSSPGSSQAWVHDLDLEVRAPDGTVYRGNVFSGGVSVPGGSADPVNNVEEVLLPSPSIGDWLLTVHATAAPIGPQGFAIVASGALADAPGPFLVVDAASFEDACSSDLSLGANLAVNPGERLALRVRLRNAGSSTATGVVGSLLAAGPGYRIVDGSASWPDLTAGGASGPEPGDGYIVDVEETAACGAALSFEQSSSSIEGAWDDGFALAVQENPRIPVWEDDFEADRGWAVVAPNDAAAGNWERGDPQGTLAQPEDDHTAAPGTVCWVTGVATGGSDGGNDVDAGTTTLLSPPIDLSAAVDPVLEYWRWFSNDRGGGPGEDRWIAQVSFDGGGSWSDLERTTSSGLGWELRTSRLLDLGVPGPDVRVRFQAEDLVNASLVEAAVDDVRLSEPGGCEVCLDDSTPPGEASGPGGSPFRIDRSATDGFALSWSEPATGGRSAEFMLYRSPFDSYAPVCDGSLGAGTDAERPSLADGAYLVVARNAGGEGAYGSARAPAPAPCP